MCLEDINWADRLNDFTTNIITQLTEISQSEEPIYPIQKETLKKIYRIYKKRLYGTLSDEKAKRKAQQILDKKILAIPSGERNYLLRNQILKYSN